ncbi:hypothetical protein BABINDRAFT_171316 [Babjeviella inositovora NRRL Y-12698]|uniref:AB hydrolase-1 domain-containing protein n=1 Tax=Babjeviella inositovora NRRL Y-12698 TaxID=984486 RepID=A0A1E3QRU2_9ASCO|nr:uncharacterized protein BABINDRAFT_171316 [Babjeviella inositovora NRRL Y-12698]ODQ80415.1 hypothetical protein BABINDRAFT_171316 [Babjeviella inositovora NRRL Y-12698]
MNKLKKLLSPEDPAEAPPVRRSSITRRSLKLLRNHSSSSLSTMDNPLPRSPEDSDDPNTERRKSKLTVNYASSIIGGSSVKHTTNEPKPKSSHDAMKTDDEVATDRKVFSFSLPFGNTNPLALPLSLPRKFLGSFTNHPESDEGYSMDELRLRLERQELINTMEEEFLFKDLKKLQSSRFSAVKRTLTPDIENLRQLINGKKPSHEVLTNENVFEHIDGPVIILGGYRGSILRDVKTKRRLWIPFKVSLNFRKINLCLGPSDEDELKASRDIVADGMLTHVGPIDISKKLINRIRQRSASSGGCIYEFGYDWRLSCDLNSAKMAEFLRTITEKHGKKVLVIAHSMGGLITHHAMNQHPELFRGVVYAGVPYECPNVLGPIRFGDVVLVNNNILTPEVNFMMRSSYVFLPTDGRLFKDRKTGERFDLNYFDPDVWVEYNLNPLVCKKRKLREEAEEKKGLEKGSTGSSLTGVSKLSAVSMKRTLSSFTNHFASENYPPQVEDEDMGSYAISFSEAYDYLTRTLKRTAKFIEELNFKPDLAAEYPPLAIVYGNTTPSMRHSRVPGLQGIKDGDYYDFAYGHGDGVIHQKWLMPERRGFPIVEKVPNMNAVGHALRSILEEENKREAQN